VAARHRHILDLRDRQLQCACQACKILFDRPAAGGGHLRLVPDRRRRPEGFELDDVTWAGLGVPVGIAFFFHSDAAGRVVAAYPGPAGATESLLELDAWPDHPALREMEADVEALLVNRARGARDDFIVGIDECYRLVGLIRADWHGLTGGQEVWRRIDGFFEELRREAR
jgi:hypothetical protein